MTEGRQVEGGHRVQEEGWAGRGRNEDREAGRGRAWRE